jgi:hypothetical protein
MPYSIHANGLTSPRARLLAAAALVSGMLLAGCGGSSDGPTATVGGATNVTRAAATTTASTGTGSIAPSGLAFARCIRSHGVPNFPDPSPGGGLLFALGAGINPSSPAVQAAHAK